MDISEKRNYLGKVENCRAFLYNCLEDLESYGESVVNADEKYTKEYSKLLHEHSKAVADWRTTKLRKEKRRTEIMYDIKMKMVDAAVADLESWGRMYLAFEIGTQEDG